MHPLPRRIFTSTAHRLRPDTAKGPHAFRCSFSRTCGDRIVVNVFFCFTRPNCCPSREIAQATDIKFPRFYRSVTAFLLRRRKWATESWFAALDLGPPQPNTSRNGSHTGLSNAPQLALRRLLTDYGPALLEDPARVHALLADLSGSCFRERFLLVHALQEHIPAELLVQHLDDTDQLQQLSQRFQRRYWILI